MTGPLIVIFVGAGCTVAGFGWLLIMHGKGRLDLVDCVTERLPGGERKASLRKVGEAVALGATTFVVVYDSLKATGSNEWVFALYATAWISRTLLGMLAQARAGAIEATIPGQK